MIKEALRHHKSYGPTRCHTPAPEPDPFQLDQLIDKLRKLEALHEGAASDGERAAAASAGLLGDTADVALILNPQLSRLEFLCAICEELGVALPDARGSNKALTDALNRFLLENHSRGRRTIVIVDEAQNLERPVLLTALSRLGEGCKVVLTHDVAQRDNLRVGRHDGIASVVDALSGHQIFGHTTLRRSERGAIAALVAELLDEPTE